MVTPGNWSAGAAGADTPGVYSDQSDLPVARCPYLREQGRDRREALANAHLLAASKGLLAACDEARNALEALREVFAEAVVVSETAGSKKVGEEVKGRALALIDMTLERLRAEMAAAAKGAG